MFGKKTLSGYAGFLTVRSHKAHNPTPVNVICTHQIKFLCELYLEVQACSNRKAGPTVAKLNACDLLFMYECYATISYLSLELNKCVFFQNGFYSRINI